ncbi:MAG TPA: MBL fold metallo-hydrolase [Methanosarcina sp.]|nr:MBL fold metallo-hydrolase [Methanosarcina sp.]
MTLEIKTIVLKNYLGNVNCYLIKTDTGFILIDTGWANKRKELEKELERAGCTSGNLELIILTHGDFDHTGNSAYIGKKFGSKIAMQSDDSRMVENGDMFWNRKKTNVFTRTAVNALLGILGLRPDRFKPDISIDEGDDLSKYGFNAVVLHIPGHSKGSIGILTTEGDFFCGDLLENTDKPAAGSIIDDPMDFNASIEKLGKLEINTVYPGHGKPFQMTLLTKSCKKLQMSKENRRKI